MKISCPSCSAKYSIADEKVQARLAKIRCRKCGTSIVIDGNVSPPSVYAGEPGGDAGAADAVAQDAPTTAGRTFTVDFGENDQRQMTTAELVQAYSAGTVTADTYLWTDGFADWTPLGQVDDVVAALHAAAGSALDETSAAGASTAPDENPWADSAAKAAGAPAAAVPAVPAAAAAAAAAARAPAADLFGGIERAGSELEVATSASTGSSNAGAAADPFALGRAAPSGARNESSVLFSLSALTSAAGTSKPSMPSSSTSASVSEDSGLIDLKALTAAAEHKPLAVAAPVVAAAPLGAPLGAPLAGAGLGLGGPSLPPQKAKSNMGLYVGGGIVVAVVAATLIFRLTEKEEPVAPPAPVAAPIATTPLPAATAATLPTAPSLPTAEAQAPSTGTAEDTPAPKTTTTTKTATKKSSGTSSSSSSGSTTSSGSSSSSSSTGSSGSSSPAPKKKSSGCGCAADDLICNMRCSSK